MKKSGIVIVTLICIGLASLAAQAATVTYTFNETVAGSWDVYAQVTDGVAETAGLSAYSVWVYTTPATVSYAENILNDAFSGFLPPNLSQGDVGGDFNAGNYQSSGGFALVGVGISPVVSGAVNLGVPALLGTLSTPAGLGVGDLAGTSAGLLNPGNTGYLETVGVASVVNPIPEPVTMVLLGLGGLAVLISRRR